MNAKNPAEDASSPPAPPRTQFPLWISAVLIAGWIVGVALLAWFTSNPVTLNRQQILDSELVAVGKVQSQPGQSGPHYTIEPVKDAQWPFPNREPVGVSNLPETGAAAGETYLFPLTRHAGEGVAVHGDYFITPTHLPNAAPLVYPVTGETLKQLEQILTEKPGAAALPPKPPAVHD